MKTLLACTVCLVLTASTVPAFADATEDAVRKNCAQQIVDNSDVTRNQLKSFRVNKIGGGYEMVGYDSSNRIVSCKTDETGRVKWVKVG